MNANADAAFDSYLAQWLAAEPEARLQRLFLPEARRADIVAWCCLERELGDAAFLIRDAGVAQAKLGWWLEEIQRLLNGAAAHPITRYRQHAGSLLPDEGKLLQRAVAAAARAAGNDALATSVDWLPVVRAMIEPFALLRAQALGREPPEDRTLNALAAARLIAMMRHWPRFAEPQRLRVPMDLLARLDLNRGQAQGGSTGAVAAAGILTSLAPVLEASVADAGMDAARVLAAKAALARMLASTAWIHDAVAPNLGFAYVWSLWRVAHRT